VILTESEQKDNPFAERKENTERMIKDILFEKIYPEELQPLVLDNVLENKGNLNIEKIKSPKNLGDQENQPENLLQEKVPEQTNQKKNKKKNQKGVLVSNENKPSWRDELDKMLK